MEYKALEVAAQGYKVKIGFLSRGLYQLLAPRIDPAEEIALVAEGLDRASANKAPVVVTNRTIYAAKYKGVMGGLDAVAIPLSRVTSVESSSGELASVTVYEGTTAHTFEGFLPLAAMELSTIIRERIGGGARFRLRFPWPTR